MPSSNEAFNAFQKSFTGKSKEERKKGKAKRKKKYGAFAGLIGRGKAKTSAQDKKK